MKNFVEIGKIFDKYPVKFPVDEKLVLLTGVNGSGKTQTLLALKKYFNKMNVMYFETERILKLNEEDIDAFIEYSETLFGENILFTKYHIKIDLVKNNLKYVNNKYINDGIFKIIDLYCNISSKNIDVLLLDLPENNLSLLYQNELIDNLFEYCNLKKLFIVTHSPDILSRHIENMIRIEECVNLRG